MDEPSNQVVCGDCTTPYAPDVAACPHCGTPNPRLEEHLAGVTTFDTEDGEPAGRPVADAPPLPTDGVDETGELVDSVDDTDSSEE